MKKLYCLFLLAAAFVFAACEPGEDTGDTIHSITVTASEGGQAAATVDGVAANEAKKDVTVTVTATADEGYVFDKWVTDTKGVEFADAEEEETTFVMPDTNVSVKAEFRVIDETPYAITVTDDGNGTAEATIDGEPADEAMETTVVTLTATPDPGYLFDKWTTESEGVMFDDETAVETTFEMPAGEVEIKATFKEQENPGEEYDITLSDDGNGTAAASVQGTVVEKALEGATVTIAATPESDEYVFGKWTVVSGGITLADANVSPTTFRMPAGAVEIKAEFKEYVPPVKYPISVTYSTGGTAKPTIGGQTIAEAEAGATVILTATINPNYKLDEWTSSSPGVTIENKTSLSTSFIMPSNAVEIRAEFVEDTDNYDVLNEVPDQRLRAYLLNTWDGVRSKEGGGIEFGPKDGKITRAEASLVHRIDVAGTPTEKCTTMKGIEQFPNLTALDCTANNLESIDVSQNKALVELMCADNRFTTLNVRSNTALEKLFCGINQLTEIDLSQNKALKNLGCANNDIGTLNLSNNNALTKLDCFNNPLGSLNVSGCAALQDLMCTGTGLTTLDVSNNTNLLYLTVSKNSLTSINVGNLTKLQTFSCMNNQIRELDVTGCTSLGYLDCSGNRMSELNASNMVTRISGGGDYTLFCGRQTSNGTTAQTLTLTLSDALKEAWNRRWYSNANNINVVLAE